MGEVHIIPNAIDKAFSFVYYCSLGQLVSEVLLRKDYPTR